MFRHSNPPRPHGPARLRLFLHCERGGSLSALVVVLLPVLLFGIAVAIDLAHTNAQRRYVQSQADLAALSAVRHLASAEEARAAARQTVSANLRHIANPMTDNRIVFGTSGAGQSFTASADQSTTEGANAVRVIVTSPVRVFLLGLFLDSSRLSIMREAIASADLEPARISFALSNCTLNLLVLRPLLVSLLPINVDVLCSGRGVDAGIDIFPTLTELAIRTNLITPSGLPLTYGDVLNAQLPVSDVLAVLTGQPVALLPDRVRLADFLYVAPDLAAVTLGSPIHSVHLQLSDLLFGTLELLTTRVANLSLGLNLGGIAGIGATVQISEPRRIVIGATPGDPSAFARTSQISININEINILGLIKLKISLNVANARVHLSDQGNACARGRYDNVAVFDPVDATLLDLTLNLQVLGLPLSHEAYGTEVDTITQRETRSIAFTRDDWDRRIAHRFGPTGQNAQDTLVSTLTNSTSALLRDVQTTLNSVINNTCRGLLGCLIGSVDALLRNTLQNVVATVVQTAVNLTNVVGAEGTLTNAILRDLVGLDIARADLELLELGCGAPGSGPGGNIAATNPYRIVR